MVVWWLYQSMGSSRLELWVWFAGWRSEGGENEKGMREDYRRLVVVEDGEGWWLWRTARAGGCGGRRGLVVAEDGEGWWLRRTVRAGGCGGWRGLPPPPHICQMLPWTILHHP